MGAAPPRPPQFGAGFQCPAPWGIGDLHQTAAVGEEPCPFACFGGISQKLSTRSALILVEIFYFFVFFVCSYDDAKPLVQVGELSYSTMIIIGRERAEFQIRIYIG